MNLDVSGIPYTIYTTDVSGRLLENSWPVAKDSVKESMQSILETLLEPPTKLHEIVLAAPAAPVAPVLAVEVSKPTKKSRCTIV